MTSTGPASPITALLNTVGAQPGDLAVQRDGVAAVSAMLPQEQAPMDFAEAKRRCQAAAACVDWAMATLGLHGADPSIADKALFLLRQVAWGADDRGSLHRIIPTVANTLVKHTGAPLIVEHGVTCLSLLVTSPTNHAALKAAVPAVLLALEPNMTVAAVHTPAMSLLQELAPPENPLPLLLSVVGSAASLGGAGGPGRTNVSNLLLEAGAHTDLLRTKWYPARGLDVTSVQLLRQRLLSGADPSAAALTTTGPGGGGRAIGGWNTSSCGQCAECAARASPQTPLPPLRECTEAALRPFLELVTAHPKAVYMQYQAITAVTAVLDGGPTGSAELQSRARAAALCVDWLLTVLQVHGGNDALATPAVRILRTVCWGAGCVHDDTSMLCVVDPLLAVARARLACPTVVEDVLACVYNLTLGANVAPLLQALPIIMQGIRVNPNAVNLVHVGLGALWRLAERDAFFADLLPAVDMVLDVMQGPLKGRADVMSVALRFLAHMAIHKGDGTPLVATMPVVLTVIETHIASRDVVGYGMHYIRGVSVDPVAVLPCLPFMQTAATMHAADDFVITAMCKAVCTMALHPKCIPGLLSLLPAILATLQDHSSVPPAVEAALLALGMLGVADREAGAAAGRVLLRLHTLVHPHMGVRDVAMSAVYFLSQLTQDLHRAVPMRVVLLVLAESLESFPQDAVIVSLALRALLNLADHKADPPARRQLIDMAPSLLTLLHAHAANAKVVTLTLGVLAALVQAFPGGVLVGQGDALRRGVEAARLRHVGHAGVEDQAGALLSKL